VGKNAVFYDNAGNDYDATVTKIIDNPISILQAFWTPYRKLGNWITEKINKSAAEKDAKVMEDMTTKLDSKPAADAATSSATPKPAFDIAKFAGIFAAIGMAVGILYVVSMVGIIAIGALLVEYMNDGTICNRAFNTLCVITISAIVLHVIGDVFYITTQNGNFELWLSVLNNIRRCIMIFLFTFFAYDSAKAQLKKTDLTK
jgi:hypothetical protein